MTKQYHPSIRIIQQNIGLVEALRELLLYKETFLQLTARHIKIRYKQTALGLIWVFLQPLAFSLILAAIFSRFVHFPTNGVPYAAFVLSVLIAWTFIARAVTEGTSSLVLEREMITKVYFPRLLVPASCVTAAAFDLVVAYTVLMPILWYFLGYLSVKVLLLPGFLALLFLLALGIVFLTSALNALYRDFVYIVGFTVQIWMYASPILYPATVWGEANQLLYAMNPLAGIVMGIRWCFFENYAFPAWPLAISVVGVIVMLIIGILVFAKAEAQMVDKI